MFSGHVAERFRFHERPGHQLVESAGEVPAGDAGERVGKPGLRVDFVELAGLDQRGDCSPVGAAAVRAREERVLAV